MHKNLSRISLVAVITAMVGGNTLFATENIYAEAIKQVNTISKASDDLTDINIYHTNDIHSRVDSIISDGVQTQIGFAKFKEYIDETSQNVDGKLVLDAGDLFHGQAFATLENGESVAKAVKAVGYDAMSPGNHDFNYGQDKLTELGKMAGVKILAGNVKTKDNKLKYEDTMIKQIGDVKVGVFGLATNETTHKTNPNNVVGLNFGNKEEMIKDTKDMVKNLEDNGADIVVGVTHLGIQKDSEVKSTDIAKEVKGIDLIIDGHSHSNLSDYQKVGDTVITSTGEYFKNLGLVNVEYNKKEDKLVKVDAKEVKASELTNTKEDEEVKEVIDTIKNDQKSILDQVIGETPIDLDGERTSVRCKHTNLGYLLTDAMLAETNADVAITNGGGIRASIKEGKITKGDVLQVLPFSNYVVTLEATGSQIIDALNHGLVVGAGSFTHFAGMDVNVKEVKDGDITKYQVVSVKINNKEIDKNKKYTVATNDFLAVGGDAYTMFGDCKKLNEYSALDEILIKYIQKEGNQGIEKANSMKLLNIISEEELKDGLENLTFNRIKPTSTSVKGKSIEGANISIYNEEGIVIAEDTVKDDGTYSINIPTQDLYTKLTIKVTKDGYKPYSKKTTVLKTFIKKLSVNNLNKNSLKISGKGQKNAYIRAYVNNKQIGKTVKVSSKGYYKINISKQKKGTIIKIKMSKKATQSLYKEVVVK